MKIHEDVKLVIKSKENFNDGKDLLENALKAVLVYRVSAPGNIRDRLFWDKFSMFLEGVFLDENDSRKLAEIFVENEEREEYARKIIKIIDDIDSKVKVRYITNLTRALLANLIGKSDYYRCCNAIRNTLEDDLIYLSKNIEKEHLKNNIHIEFLKQNGLTVQTVISDSGEFEFTSFAHMLDKFGLDYENGEKYEYSDSIEPLSNQLIINDKVSIEVDGGEF